jgi:hypothetical protein
LIDRGGTGFNRQLGPVRYSEFDLIGRRPEPTHASDGLARRRAGANFRRGVRQADCSIGRHFDLGKTGFRSGAEAPVARRKSNAVVFARMRGVIGTLAGSPALPQRMRLGFLQHGFAALDTVRDGALGRSHPGLQHIAQPKLDRIQAKFGRDLVHHQLGCGDRLGGAVAACRTAVEGARCDRCRRDVALGEVVDRIRLRRSRHRQKN